MIVAGVTTELGTYTVTGATGATSTTAVLSVGTLASIAASRRYLHGLLRRSERNVHCLRNCVNVLMH